MTDRDLKYEEIWKTQDFEKTIPLQSPEETIPLAPPSKAPSIGGTSLPQFLTEENSERPIEFALGATIGEGGMGLVRLAQQVPLRRDVAVKTLREDREEAGAAWELLREAWLTGALEHPNIIPVYSLGQSASGLPMLVMKKVEGTTWHEFLHDSEKLENEESVTDILRWHLDILLQVCHAVEFAHSKGILHRDIKPGNVMIGAFGEVYLLDWGIAVSMLEKDRGRLPLCSEVKRVVGTPRYMAPEMAEADPKAINETTDVYLLGAVLHEILTGEAPNQGTSLFKVLLAAFRSNPYEYDSSVPTELGKICHKAMSRYGTDRYQSAANFVRVIEEFLEHRDSLALSQESINKMPLLRELAEQEDLEISDDELTKRFGECRFGFQHALRAWPENLEAREGLQEAFEIVIRIELNRSKYQTAARYLRELPSPNNELQEQVEQLRASWEKNSRNSNSYKTIWI
jgi:eukaryotic-like serine/threonine-protein kinase